MTIRFSNLPEFNRALNEFAKCAGEAPDKICRELAFSIFRGVVQRNPVDTGYSRANWQMAPDRPPTGNVYNVKSRDNQYPAPQPRLARSSNPRAPVYWVVNNVDYIVKLEDGYSKQMGKGYMVQRTLVAAEEQIKRKKKALCK